MEIVIVLGQLWSEWGTSTCYCLWWLCECLRGGGGGGGRTKPMIRLAACMVQCNEWVKAKWACIRGE